MRAPESSRTREVPRDRDKRTEKPCRLERRALPGVVTRNFDQEPRLPGLVDAKGIASSRILSNLQTSPGGGARRSTPICSH